MDGPVIGALLGIGGLTVVNVVVVAYSYGKTSQKVTDLCRRVGRLEDLYNNKVKKGV